MIRARRPRRRRPKHRLPPRPPRGRRPSPSARRVEPGGNGIGPTLAGVFGVKAGHVDDFAYSQAMRRSGLVWDEPTLGRYLEAPRELVPGTRMSYAGLDDPAQRQAVIAYLKTL